MKTKTEMKNEIYTLQKKAIKLVNKPNKTREEGAEANRMLEVVINMEDAYMEIHGRNPSKEYGDIDV